MHLLMLTCLQSPSLSALFMYLHGGMPHLNHEKALSLVARNDLIMAKLLHPFWLELAGKSKTSSLQKNPGCSSSVGVVNFACLSGCVECMECVDYHAQCVEVGRSASVIKTSQYLGNSTACELNSF